MSKAYELKAEARERVGKGSARDIRRNGRVPAVIYGDKKAPVSISLDYKELYYKIHGGGFMHTVATLPPASGPQALPGRGPIGRRTPTRWESTIWPLRQCDHVCCPRQQHRFG